jgi:uroporphyrinogen decarboxylase
MNSLERIQCAVRLDRPDVIPVAPYLGNHGARVAGIPIDEYCQSGELMAQAQQRAWEIYGQDMVVPQSDNYYIAEGFGLEVEHHRDSTPTPKHPLLNVLDDIFHLRIPNPQRDGRMPVYLEAIRRLGKIFKGKVAVRAPGTGPFSLAAHLLGTERFLIELLMADRNPGGPEERALRQLMETTTQALIAFAKASLEAGADIVQAGDSLASTDMISPQMYEKWAFPFEKKFFSELNPAAKPYGAATLLHICGNTTRVLELMADTGAQILELDSKVELKTAKAKVGQRVCLMGNLNPTGVLLQGSLAEVENAAKCAISDAGTAGFILGSGCEVPVAAPQQNIQAMIRTARSPSE